MYNAIAAYQIPDQQLPELKAKVTRLGNRCARLGLPRLTLAEVHTDERVCVRRVSDYAPPRRYVLPCTRVELSGASPVVEGYLFLAKVEHTEAGNMVSAPATDELGPEYDLTAYRTAAPNCDHCNTDRARKETFVLRAPDGAIKQIGRNCLADFLRNADAEIACGILALIEEIHAASRGGDMDEDGEGGGGRWIQATSTGALLACAVQSCRREGFKPSKMDGSTKDRAIFLSGPCPEGNGRDGAEARRDWTENQPTDEDGAKAILVRAWVAANTDQSDYMHNLRVACALPSATKHEGVIVSAVSAYERAMGREAIRKAEKTATATSEYQGTVKVRATWILTVLRKASWATDFGTTILHIMTDAAGNVFSWKSLGSSDALNIGQTYAITGTVKKHEEYKGTKQTQLTRCAAADPNAPPPPAKVRKPRAPKGFALPGSNQA